MNPHNVHGLHQIADFANAGGSMTAYLSVDATYNYYCQAVPGTAATDPFWRVIRVRKDGTEVRIANKGAFDCLGTEASVAGLSYT